MCSISFSDHFWGAGILPLTNPGGEGVGGLGGESSTISIRSRGALTVLQSTTKFCQPKTALAGGQREMSKVSSVAKR